MIADDAPQKRFIVEAVDISLSQLWLQNGYSYLVAWEVDMLEAVSQESYSRSWLAESIKYASDG